MNEPHFHHEDKYDEFLGAVYLKKIAQGHNMSTDTDPRDSKETRSTNNNKLFTGIPHRYTFQHKPRVEYRNLSRGRGR